MVWCHFCTFTFYNPLLLMDAYTAMDGWMSTVFQKKTRCMSMNRRANVLLWLDPTQLLTYW